MGEPFQNRGRGWLGSHQQEARHKAGLQGSSRRGNNLKAQQKTRRPFFALANQLGGAEGEAGTPFEPVPPRVEGRVPRR